MIELKSDKNGVYGFNFALKLFNMLNIGDGSIDILHPKPIENQELGCNY